MYLFNLSASSSSSSSSSDRAWRPGNMHPRKSQHKPHTSTSGLAHPHTSTSGPAHPHTSTSGPAHPHTSTSRPAQPAPPAASNRLVPPTPPPCAPNRSQPSGDASSRQPSRTPLQPPHTTTTRLGPASSNQQATQPLTLTPAPTSAPASALPHLADVQPGEVSGQQGGRLQRQWGGERGGGPPGPSVGAGAGGGRRRQGRGRQLDSE